MKFRLLLRAAGLLAMLVTIATRSSQANSPVPPDTAILNHETPPPYAIRYVSIRRPPPLAACTNIAARGPSIDAIEVRRRGVVISTGVAPFLSATQCMTGVPTDKASPSLGGAPDGVGVALGGNEYAWALGEHVSLQAGDEIVVTVVGGTNEPFQVFSGADQLVHPMELGTLAGTGTVTVPAR